MASANHWFGLKVAVDDVRAQDVVNAELLDDVVDEFGLAAAWVLRAESRISGIQKEVPRVDPGDLPTGWHGVFVGHGAVLDRCVGTVTGEHLVDTPAILR